MCVVHVSIYEKCMWGRSKGYNKIFETTKRELYLYKIQSAILVHYCTFGTGYNYPGVTYFTIYCVSHVKKITDLIKRLEDYGTYCYNCYSTCTPLYT